MLTISKSRINKIKKDLENKLGKEEYRKFIVKAKDGLFLFDMLKNPFYEDRYMHVEKEIPGLEIVDCSHCNIRDIIVAGNGTQEPVIICIDIPDDEELEKAIMKVKADNTSPTRLNFEDLSNEELKKIIDYCESDK